MLESSSRLTNEQAKQLIEHWSKFTPYEKKSVTFSPRHQASKSSLPGVDSTER